MGSAEVRRFVIYISIHPHNHGSIAKHSFSWNSTPIYFRIIHKLGSLDVSHIVTNYGRIPTRSSGKELPYDT